MPTVSQFPVACFAVPLTDERLAEYELLIDAMSEDQDETRDCMLACLHAVQAWWAIPESTSRPDRWKAMTPAGDEIEFDVRPLEEQQVQALWEAVPWMRELEAMKPVFEKLPSGKLRDAAHDLLWHTIELCNDREPVMGDAILG